MSDIVPHYFLHVLLLIVVWGAAVYVPLCTAALLQNHAPATFERLWRWLGGGLGHVGPLFAGLGNRFAGFRDRRVPTDADEFDWEEA